MAKSIKTPECNVEYPYDVNWIYEHGNPGTLYEIENGNVFICIHFNLKMALYMVHQSSEDKPCKYLHLKEGILKTIRFRKFAGTITLSNK